MKLLSLYIDIVNQRIPLNVIVGVKKEKNARKFPTVEVRVVVNVKYQKQRDEKIKIKKYN